MTKKIELTLKDGKKHELRYDVNAFSALEEKTDVSFLAFNELLGIPGNIKSKKTPDNKALMEMGRKVKISGLRLMVWAGLLHEHEEDDEEFTLQDAGKLIPTTPSEIGNVILTVAQAYRAAIASDMIEAEEKEKGKNEQRPNPQKKSQAKNS